METYLPAAKKSWFDFYSENRAARRDDPAHVRKEFLRGHELAQPTPAEVWDDPAKTNLLALTNSVKGGMSNVRLDDIEPVQAAMNIEPKRKKDDANDDN